MNQLNSIIIEGNLARDAVLSEPVAGFKVCRFTIGVNRFFKNHNGEGTEEVSYFDVETYGPNVEYCEKKAKKGRGVRIVGRLKQSTWKDEDGKYNSRIYVVAEHIEYKPVFQKSETSAPDTTDTTAEVPSEIPAKVTETVPEAVAF